MVCIVASGDDRTELCLRSVLAHTAEEVPVIICGASHDDPLPLGDLGPRIVSYAGEFEPALDAAGPADVAVLSADCVVAAGWLDELRALAYSDARVATVSTLVAGDGPNMVDLPPEITLDEAAATIRATPTRIHPRLAGAYGSCVYVRRSALELTGSFGDWDRFSSRCVHNGLSHLLADEVLIQGGGCRVMVGRQGRTEQVGRSLAGARRRLRGLSLLIDVRRLGAQTGGTKLHVLELLAALAQTADVRAAALVSDEREAASLGTLEAFSQIELIAVSMAQGSGGRVDVVHRPYQVGTPADLAVLGSLGDRLVITHQDLIGYQNPFYFGSRDRWEGYRAITRRALSAADRVIFPSAHACTEALAEELVEPNRSCVVRHGVDHVQVRRHQRAAVQPVEAARLPADTQAMVCIGTDYSHKNRPFALRMLDHLRRHRGWRGWLVFAGPHMPWGSSAAEEAELLARAPELADAVLDVGEVSEGEKAWLFSRAALMLYPTVYEGFGLIPFEAADHGVPCLWAKGIALSEVLPDSAAGIEPWDVESSAEHALMLMQDAAAKEHNLRAIREAGRALRWELTAKQLVEIYAATCDQPPSPAGMRERQEGGLLGLSLSEDALRLVGPDGALPRELERPLLALAGRRRLSRPLFGALRAGYLASARWRRRRSDGSDGSDD